MGRAGSGMREEKSEGTRAKAKIKWAWRTGNVGEVVPCDDRSVFDSTDLAIPFQPQEQFLKP